MAYQSTHRSEHEEVELKIEEEKKEDKKGLEEEIRRGRGNEGGVERSGGGRSNIGGDHIIYGEDTEHRRLINLK